MLYYIIKTILLKTIDTISPDQCFGSTRRDCGGVAKQPWAATNKVEERNNQSKSIRRKMTEDKH